MPTVTRAGIVPPPRRPSVVMMYGARKLLIPPAAFISGMVTPAETTLLAAAMFCVRIGSYSNIEIKAVTYMRNRWAAPRTMVQKLHPVARMHTGAVCYFRSFLAGTTTKVPLITPPITAPTAYLTELSV